MNIKNETAGWFLNAFFNKYFINIKLFIFIFSVILIIFIACDFKINSGNSGSEPKIIDSSFITEYQPLTELTARQDIMNLITGNKYYLDAVNGNDDTGNGSSTNPWSSLSKVKEILQGGDGLILRTGNYGEFDDKYIHDNWVVIINEEGETPEFTNIKLRNNLTLPYPSLHLVFYGIKICPVNKVDTNLDPQDPLSTYETYAQSDYPIDCKSVQDIEFYHCEISNPLSKYLTRTGANLWYIKNIKFEKCYIHKVESGIYFSDAVNCQFYYNKIEDILATHIGDSGDSSKIVIEGNYLYNRNWNKTEDYCPKNVSDPYHGSYVSIRSSNFIVRNNIMRDGGGSSGIMLYGDVTAPSVYNNILIENNLVYDTHTQHVLRIYNLGSNIIIRNNTIIGRVRDGFSGVPQYWTALFLHSTGSGHNGSGLKLHNNIFVGMSIFQGYFKNVNEDNNIFWSLTDDQKSYYDEDQLKSSSRVITSNTTSSDYFENGFFNGVLDVSWDYNADPNIFPNPPGHGNVLDLTHANGSESINFGDPNHQPVDSIGTLDNDGFLQPNGKSRNENYHSAGCYEY